MLTRGKMIGEIIDSLSQLRLSITPRNKLGYTNLNIYCEDFFKEIINIIEEINLINLNQEKPNYPGIDLGDKNARVAYQITTDKSTSKVKETLTNISSKDKELYDDFYIFIIGEKQGQYTLKNKYLEIANEINFDKKDNIIDLNYIYKKTTSLSLDNLEKVYTLIKRDLMRVQAELEIPDVNNNYENEIFKYLEKRTYSKPKNSIKLFNFLMGDFPKKGHYWPGIEDFLDEVEFHKDMIKFYNKLKSLPRITREFYSVLLKESTSSADDSYYKINYAKIKRFFSLSQNIINEELNLLEEERLIYFEEINYSYYICFDGIMEKEYFYHYLKKFLEKNDVRFKIVFVNLDFNQFAKKLTARKDAGLTN
ncbi:SMEK domain-containing protein [Halanaerobium saccharolyticum]|nr:SMEK domain-containing protein [Halanaerobium saccharolyticum]